MRKWHYWCGFEGLFAKELLRKSVSEIKEESKTVLVKHRPGFHWECPYGVWHFILKASLTERHST